jgi:hypothetical protein
MDKIKVGRLRLGVINVGTGGREPPRRKEPTV